MYHAQQARAWTANIIEGFEGMMENAGIHSRLERVPAICFLDISGYTRLTQERGDDAAADMATTMSRLVQRSSVQHGGKPIKWLGDGVMFLLPRLLYQEGDYFGQTVNLSARIADYARSGEVLVTPVVVDGCRDQSVSFADIGPVELKGFSVPVHLLKASPA